MFSTSFTCITLEYASDFSNIFAPCFTSYFEVAPKHKKCPCLSSTTFVYKAAVDSLKMYSNVFEKIIIDSFSRIIIIELETEPGEQFVLNSSKGPSSLLLKGVYHKRAHFIFSVC